MTTLTQSSPADLQHIHQQSRERYDAFKKSGLTLNLTRGKPSTPQLDLNAALLTLPGNGDYTAADGTDCRNYGALQGLPEMRALLAPTFGVPPDRVIVGDNSSLSLMHDAVVFALLKGTCDSARPWSAESRTAFLCPVPGYDRHFAICQELGIDMIPVDLTDDGPDMDQVEALVAGDASIRGMWCMPKYSNPTGTVYSAATIERIAAMKTAGPDFRLWWDDAYCVHHLTPERIAIASIDEACSRHGHPNRAFIFGSTSKITFAGGGVAIFAGSKANVSWYLKRIEKRTIGSDKINQLRQVRHLKDQDGLMALMDRHRAIMAPKFNKVIEVFEQNLGSSGVATWTTPKGGYFITLDVMDGCAKRVIQLAKEAGVELTPAGAPYPYGKDPRDRTIRIAPSFPDLAEVAKAAEGVTLAVLVAATEKLLAV